MEQQHYAQYSQYNTPSEFDFLASPSVNLVNSAYDPASSYHFLPDAPLSLAAIAPNTDQSHQNYYNYQAQYNAASPSPDPATGPASWRVNHATSPQSPSSSYSSLAGSSGPVTGNGSNNNLPTSTHRTARKRRGQDMGIGLGDFDVLNTLGEFFSSFQTRPIG